MKRTLILSAIAASLVVASLGFFVWLRPEAAKTGAAALNNRTGPSKANNLITAPGVVEAVSEEIEVGAEIPGKLKEVSVEEGDHVTKGQIVAVLENADYAAQVESTRAQIETLRRQQDTARARLAEAEADKLRLVNGARVQERREAQAAFEQTLPVVENARREVERRRILCESGAVSREEYERARRDLDVAQKQSAAMREKFAFINADVRADDLQKADARIQIVAAQIREFDALITETNSKVKEAEARLGKTIVRAPLTGVVLRKRLKSGESISPENSKTGIVTIGDTSALRVRVDLDENDVARIREGQRAFVTADAYGERKFAAKVIKIGQILGRKNLRTERPTERVDTKILEVLLALDPGQKLPVGLRVDVFIATYSGQ